jgi:hypothetical protein
MDVSLAVTTAYRTAVAVCSERAQVYLRVDEKASIALGRQQEQLAHVRELVNAATVRCRGASSDAAAASAGGLPTGGLLAGLAAEQRQAVMRLYHQTAALKVPAVAEYVKVRCVLARLSFLLHCTARCCCANTLPEQACLVSGMHIQNARQAPMA